jgi:hypothetical protein
LKAGLIQMKENLVLKYLYAKQYTLQACISQGLLHIVITSTYIHYLNVITILDFFAIYNHKLHRLEPFDW